MSKSLRIHQFVLLLMLMIGCATAQAERARYDRAAPDKLFADVVLDLELGIGQQNFAVVGRNEIGQAVRQRGHPDFGDAAIVHFCNLEYARRAMEIDPTLVLYMPCRIAVFEQDNVVHAASLLLPEDTAFKAFNAMASEVNGKIREIVDYAVSPAMASDDAADK